MSARLRVGVFDYGAGNLHSLVKVLETDFTDVRVATDARDAIVDVDALVLPGVGAFAPAAARLAPARDSVAEAVRNGLPCLGICLGMQLLFHSSDEGPGDGLGLFSGRVTQLATKRVPQIGWNALDEVHDPLLHESALDIAYFANSFVCRPDTDDAPYVTAWSEHDGDRYPAAIRRGMLVGTQFHPEKSSANGVRMVRAFLTASMTARDAGLRPWAGEPR